MCILLCVFKNKEEAYLYWCWNTSWSLFVLPWRPHGDTLLRILRFKSRHENHLVRHFANGDPEGKLTLSPLANECRYGDQVATNAYLEHSIMSPWRPSGDYVATSCSLVISSCRHGDQVVKCPVFSSFAPTFSNSSQMPLRPNKTWNTWIYTFKYREMPENKHKE